MRPLWLFDREVEWDALAAFVQRGRPGLALVRGRRRHGKSALLVALAETFGGFYHQALRGVAAEQRRDLARAWAGQTGGPVPAFDDWQQTVDALLGLDVPVVVLDELPYLTDSSGKLESVLQRAVDRRRRTRTGPALIVCGSAQAVMTGLLVGSAPLRGRAQLELDVAAFDYRSAARFTGLSPAAALAVDAVVGGVPGYLVDLLDETYPESSRDVGRWLVEVVASPRRPLVHEARALVELEAGVRNPATYASVLAALAAGATRSGEIATRLGRTSDAVGHSLAALANLGLVTRAEDLLQPARPTWHVADPLLRSYTALFRPRWALVEREQHARLARAIEEPWRAQVLGPHLERLARRWTAVHASEASLGGRPVRVGAGTVNDRERRIRHELDVVALDDAGRVLMLGEAKLRRLVRSDRDRLVRLRQLLAEQGRADAQTRLGLFSAEGVDPDAARHDDTVAVDLDRLYAGV